MKRWLPVAFALLAVLASCSWIGSDDPESPAEPSEESGTGIWDEVRSVYDEARDAGETGAEDVYDWVEQDFRKIGDWEYRLVEVALDEPASLQDELNKLGADRWECFWVRPQADSLLLFLKRPAKTYLKHIPMSDLMKLIPVQEDGTEE